MEMELEFSSFWGGGWGENLQYHTEEKKKKASLSMKIKDHLRNISARFT